MLWRRRRRTSQAERFDQSMGRCKVPLYSLSITLSKYLVL